MCLWPVLSRGASSAASCSRVVRAEQANGRPTSAPGVAAAGKRHSLSSRRVEIRGVEPTLVAGPHTRPIAIDDRKPGGIATSPFVDDRLAKDALEREPEAERRAPRSRVQAVALPLETPVVELVERPSCEQKDRLRRGECPLESWRIVHVPKLDHAVRGRDPFERGDAPRLPRRFIDQRVKERIGSGLGLLHPGAIGREIGQRILGKIDPVRLRPAKGCI